MHGKMKLLICGVAAALGFGALAQTMIPSDKVAASLKPSSMALSWLTQLRADATKLN